MLIRWIAAQPDISMTELAAKLAAATETRADPASLSRALRVAGYRYIKTPDGVGMRTR